MTPPRGTRDAARASVALLALVALALFPSVESGTDVRAAAGPAPDVSAGPESGASALAAPRDSAAERIDAFVRRVMDEVGVIPGMAVAVVRGDRVLLARGYGEADLEAGVAADARTAFYIASSTKSYTGLAAAVLAERGELELDAPVGRYLAELDLPDPLDEDAITVRQLLTHTHGLDNDPLTIRTAFTGQHDGPTFLRVLNEYTSATDTAFGYSNVGYVVTSRVLDRISGGGYGGWKEVLARELFRPLGMERTTAHVSRARRAGWTRAQPYRGGPDGPERLPYLKADETMHAAGGLLTSAEDLARWLEANLNDGRVDGRQAIPAAAVREAHRMQAELDADFHRFHRYGYGLGWYHSDYEGDLLLHHFGGFDGFRAHVSLMPEHDLGVAAVINETSAGFFVPDIVATYAYDLLLGKEELRERYDERVGEAVARVARVQEGVREDRANRATRPERPERPLPSYTGVYRSPVLGTITIRERDGALHLATGRVRSPMTPYTARDTMRFEVGGSGNIAIFHFREEADALPDVPGSATSRSGSGGLRADSLTVLGRTYRREGPPGEEERLR